MAKHHHTRETRTLVYPHGAIEPEDWLHFVRLTRFDQRWQALGFSDDDLRALEMPIVCSPRKCPVIPGTGGLRKLGFALPNQNKGKSGGARVGYVYFEDICTCGLILVFSKDEQGEIPQDIKAKLRQFIPQYQTTN